MNDAKLNIAWESLLSLKKMASTYNFDNLVMVQEKNHWLHYMDDEEALKCDKNRIFLSRHPDNNQLSGNYLKVKLDDNGNPVSYTNQLFNKDELNLFMHYLPYALLPHIAKKNNRTYAISHFAQSLDGKIATSSGQSKWISNWENLLHAHRMRALCDGILIGGNTLQRDKPKLTVRHVQGNNPVKIILGSNDYDFSSILQNEGKVIWINNHHFTANANKNVKQLSLRGHKGLISPEQILSSLYNLGIYSIYIEGGAFTTSHFLTANALDEVQVYIAPEIFGSGISSFSLSAIDSTSHAIQFSKREFMLMGDGVLFKGILNKTQHDKKRTLASVRNEEHNKEY